MAYDPFNRGAMIEKFVSAQLDPRAQALVGKYTDRICLLISGGRTVWTDFRDFTRGNWHSQWDVMAVNDAGMHYPDKLEHWFSCHGEQLPGWQAVREFKYPPARYLHTMLDRHHQIIPWPVPTTGTSTLAAVHVALCLGYEQVILMGAPLDDEGHFFDPHWVKSNFTNEARHDIWRWEAEHLFEGKVKSMSGFSRQILGAP